jgi:hypothetical protein
MFRVEKCRGGHGDRRLLLDASSHVPRTENSMTGQGQQIMIVALWGPTPRLELRWNLLSHSSCANFRCSESALGKS